MAIFVMYACVLVFGYQVQLELDRFVTHWDVVHHRGLEWDHELFGASRTVDQHVYIHVANMVKVDRRRRNNPIRLKPLTPQRLE